VIADHIEWILIQPRRIGRRKPLAHFDVEHPESQLACRNAILGRIRQPRLVPLRYRRVPRSRNLPGRTQPVRRFLYGGFRNHTVTMA
jgi:hypothetical protein